MITINVLLCPYMAIYPPAFVCSNPWIAIYRSTRTLHQKRWVTDEVCDDGLILMDMCGPPVEIKLIKH